MNSARAMKNLERVRALADPCRLCPRHCGARRLGGEIGACGAGPEPRLFMEYVHWGEDEDIVPAHAIYLTGCNLACRFCQTGLEQKTLAVKPLISALFSALLERGRREGAKTVDIFGGEPTVNMPGLFELFAAVGDFPGLVWNTNLYGEAETFALLDGVADVFLGDLKFGNANCAAVLSGAEDACDVSRMRAAEIMARSPEALIVRHLVMPGHFDCCTRPVLEWIAENLPGVRVSLKTGYMPPKEMLMEWPESRFLRAEEVERAKRLASVLGLRLTRDAVLPVEQAANFARGKSGEAVDAEVVITPDGTIHLRHVLREIADAAMAAVGANGGERSSGS